MQSEIGKNLLKEVEPTVIVERLFHRLRKHLQLGIGELEAALDSVMAGMGCQNDADLQMVLRLLWCHSLESRADFDAQWVDLVKELKPQNLRVTKETDAEITDRMEKHEVSSSEEKNPGKPAINSAQETAQNLGLLPTQAPPLLMTGEEEGWDSFPVNRRSLAYGWRTLRRLRADGIMDVVDVSATIDRAARQGFYGAPVFQRRFVNHSRLLLLIDREGSMGPFHRFSRDIVQTAQENCDLEAIHLQEIQVAYFHNVPQDYVYEDEHLTKPIELNSLLEWCDRETSVLIVSDGGAARGNCRMERIRSTTRFLAYLRTHTNLVSWLNPMPENRWENTSAELLAYIVPMEVMNDDGFKVAIDVVRG
jgi:uncharacterized protein